MMLSALVGVVVKVTALYCCVWLMAACLRRTAAAARHLVWATGLLGALAIPVLEVGAGWEILPRWSDPVAERVAPPPLDAPAPHDQPGSGAAPSAAQPEGSGTSSPLPVSTPDDGAAPVLVAPGLAIPPRAPAAQGWSPSLGECVPWAWLFGVLILVWRLVKGVHIVRRLLRDASACDDPAAVAALADTRSTLGVRRTVALLTSDRSPGPMTFGVFRPVVILPAEARGWSRHRLAAVLLHEMAHVKRLDCMVQLLGCISRAIYWFHPLAWLATRRLHLEQERACDDFVLRAGIRPSCYADDLMGIASGLRPIPAAALVSTAIARPADLVSRMRYLLDGAQTRRRLSSRVRGATMLAVASLAVTLGITREQTADPQPAKPAAGSRSEQDKQDKQGSTAVRQHVRRLLEELSTRGPSRERFKELVAVRKRGFPYLQQALRDPRRQVREWAMRTLTHNGPVNDQVMGALLSLITETDWNRPERVSIGMHVAACMSADAKAVRELVAIVRNETCPGRREMVAAMAKVRANHAAVVAGLGDLLDGAPAGLASWVVGALREIAGHDDLVAPVLTRAIDHEDSAVVALAIRALIFRPQYRHAADKKVRSLAGHRNPLIRAACGDFIAAIEFVAEPVAILVADYSDNRIVEFDEQGRETFTIEEIFGVWDVEALANGNLLITEFSVNRVREVTRENKTVWSFSDLKNPYDADRLPNGNTLITDTFGRRVIEVNPKGEIVWKYDTDIHPYDADRLSNGNTLIADTHDDRVIEVDKTGKIVWQIRHVPNVHDADRLPNGNTLVTIRMHNEVRELDKDGKTVFRLRNLSSPSDADRLPDGSTLVAENGFVRRFSPQGVEVSKQVVTWAVEVSVLRQRKKVGLAKPPAKAMGFHPPRILVADYAKSQVLEFDEKGRNILTIDKVFGAWDVEGLANGNLLITAFSMNRVREVTRENKTVWSFSDLKNPYDADRLSNGNTLIADTFGRRVIEVNPKGEIVWKYDTDIHPYDADRLPNGNTLIADTHVDRVIEVDPKGNIVWQIKNVPNVHDADRLPNGNTLLTIRMLNEVREVDKNGEIVFRLKKLHSPSDADRLPDGSTMVAENGFVRVFSPSGRVLWKLVTTWAVEANVSGRR